MAEFAAAINCMDGRTQTPVTDWVREWSGAKYVDMITDAGPVRILAQSRHGQAARAIRNWLEISVTAHGSTHLAVVAHADCAGNPVDKEQQLIHLKNSIETVRTWGFELEISGLWVETDGTIEVVHARV